jgi:hypothetical protein
MGLIENQRDSNFALNRVGWGVNMDEKENPSEILAGQIVDRLISKKFLEEKSRSAVLTKLAEGKMGESDWKLEFEKSLNLHKKVQEVVNASKA